MLFFGKLILFPIAFVIVFDGSMYPRISSGDMVLLVSSWIKSIDVGDVALWCIDDLRTACSLHLVTNLSSSSVVTTGISNIASDPAVPLSLVYYIEIAIIPLYVWLPLIILLIIYDLIFITKSIQRISIVSLDRDLFIVLAEIIILVVVINSFLVGLVYIDQSQLQYSVPLISLVEKRFDDLAGFSSLIINLSIYRLESVKCWVAEYDLSVETRSMNSSLIELVIKFPREYFERLWIERSREAISLPSPPASVYQGVEYSCRINLDKGFVESRFIDSFNWVEPSISIANRSVLVIKNPNPINLNMSIVIADLSRLRIADQWNITIEPGEIYERDLSTLLSKGSYEIRVYYYFLGSLRARGVSIEI